MSSNYKPGDVATPHFVTFSDVGRVDIFSRGLYKKNIPDRLRYCIDQKGLNLHAWVIMTNHVHLIISSDKAKIEHLGRDIRKFTSKQIIKAIRENQQESRKQWMLNLFAYAGRSNNNNKDFQFWKQDDHPIELNTHEKMKQRLLYLHANPVQSGCIDRIQVIRHQGRNTCAG